MENGEHKECPYCKEQIKAQAVKCRHCGSFLPDEKGGRLHHRGWTRSFEGKLIAGVCMGLAKEFNIPVTLLRLAFIIGTFIGGWGIIIYVALWFLMPSDGPVPAGTEEPESQGKEEEVAKPG